MKKIKQKKYRWETGLFGEYLVLNWFRGATQAKKRSFDIRVPTHGFNYGSQTKLEVKTARPSKQGGWQFDFSTRLQRKANFLTLLCLDEEWKTQRIYWIDNTWALPKHIWVNEGMEKWRLV